MKESAAPFDEPTATWFLQGSDPDRLAELHPSEEEPAPTGARSAWSGMISRLSHFLRRD